MNLKKVGLGVLEHGSSLYFRPLLPPRGIVSSNSSRGQRNLHLPSSYLLIYGNRLDFLIIEKKKIQKVVDCTLELLG